MADLIKIIPERLIEESGEIKECRDQHIDVMDRLNNLVMNLADIWEGKGFDSFFSRYKEIQQQLSKLPEILETYSTEMDKTAERLQSVDQSLASKINSLS